MVVANSLDEGTVSTQGNGTEVIGGTYWVYKGLDYVLSLIHIFKGPLTTPVGGGIRSLNVALRQTLDLYVCLRPVR